MLHYYWLELRDILVFPLVGSITTLFPGIRRPSCLLNHMLHYSILYRSPDIEEFHFGDYGLTNRTMYSEEVQTASEAMNRVSQM